jgi:VanZ family protein
VPRLVTSFRPRLFAALSYLVVGVLMFIPMPHGEGPPLIPHLDKFVHAGCWGLLGFATLFSMSLSRPTAFRLSWAIGLASVFGVLVELFQGLTSTRSADPWDALADTVGAILGAATAHFIESRTRRRPT